MNARVEFGLIMALTIRGLAVGNFGDMKAVAREAERLGFDSVWLCDHFLTLAPDSYAKDAGFDAAGASEGAGAGSIPLLETWTALSALSQVTKKLRLGTSVLSNSYRIPSVLAKMGATLDHVSGGRLDLGLGAGWMREEYEAYGIPFPRASVRIAQMEEAVQLIRRMWTEPSPSFEGAHYAIKGAVCDPPPVQKPSPPIWIGGEGKKVLRVAARYADGFNVRWWPPERYVERREEIDAHCEEAGRDPEGLRRSLMCLLLPGHDRARVEAQRKRFAAIPETGIISGTPRECADRMMEYVEAGARHFLYTIPDVAEMDALRLAGEEILPLVRSMANGG